MTLHDSRVRLQHMLESAEQACSLVEGKSRPILDEDNVLSLAVVRLLEIIGEAANHIPEDIQTKFPDIPWANIISLRNRLVHGYDSIDTEILWQVLSHDLPILIQNLRSLISTL